MIIMAMIISMMVTDSKTVANSSLESGITLDCARRYYAPQMLKKYIDVLGKRPNAFLQLHLTDNENVGIECDLLGQSAKTAMVKKGKYINIQTGQAFLSNKQMSGILAYARKKQVMIVPEIDTPAHMQGFFKLIKRARGKAYLKQIKRANYEGELNLNSAVALKLVKDIYHEYASLFKGCRYFHIGGDEMESASDTARIQYINTISKQLRQSGYLVRIWNDLLTKKNIKQLDKKLQVTYWSYDGDVESIKSKKSRRKLRASLADLTNAHFTVLNYNSYYLYYVPSNKDVQRDRSYMVKDIIKNWNLTKWDGQARRSCGNQHYLIGAAISVWGEDSKGVKATTIYRQSKALYQAMSNKLNK